MKHVLLIILSIVISFTVYGVGGNYRSQTSGNWTTNTTWQIQINPTTWVTPPSGVYPTDTSGTIQILNASTVTILNGESISVDQLSFGFNSSNKIVVNNGGTLTLQHSGASTYDLAFPGAGVDPRLEVSGTFIVNNNATINLSSTARMFIKNNGILRYNNTSTPLNVCIATWETGSTIEIIGYSASSNPSGLNQAFYNFTWNCPAQATNLTFNQALTTVNGDLNVLSTGSNLLSIFAGNPTSVTVNIGGNFLISGASIVEFGVAGSNNTFNISKNFTYSSTAGSSTFTGTGTNMIYNIGQDFIVTSGTLNFGSASGSTPVINLTGNFSQSGGTLNTSSSFGVTLNFVNSSVQTFSLTGTGTIPGNYIYHLSPTSKVDLGTSALSGTGKLKADAGSELYLKSLDPSGAIQLLNVGGNIRVTGTRTYSNGCNLFYNSSSGKQFMGNGQPARTGINTFFNNPSNVALATSLDTLRGTLTLTSGEFELGAFTLTLDSSFTIVPNSNHIVTTASSGLTLREPGGVTGSLPFPAGSISLGTLTLNRVSGSFTITQPLTITTCTLTAGKLIFDGQTLTLGNAFTAASGALSGNSSSILTITNSTVAGLGTLIFDPAGNSIGTLNVNCSGSGNVTLNTNLTLNTALNVTGGTFNIPASPTINLKGNLNYNSGTIRVPNGTAILKFNGSTTQTVTNGGSIVNTLTYEVASLATLSLDNTSFLEGSSAKFTLRNGGTLKVGSLDINGAIQTGTSAGNIRVGSTRTYESGSTIIYTSTLAKQYMSNGHPATVGINVKIDNTSNVDLASNVFLNGGILTLTNGNLQVVNKQLTFNSISIIPGTNFITTTSSSSIITTGTGISGTMPFQSGAVVGNLQVNQSSGNFTLAHPMTISGICNLTNGKLVFDSQILTLGGTFVTTSGTLSGNSSSKLIITSTVSLGTLKFSPTGNSISSLNKNGAGSATLNSALTLKDSLKLLNGNFINTSGLTFLNGLILLREPSGSLTITRPTLAATEKYDMIYQNGVLTTGLELPDPLVVGNQDDLNNLTINGGPVTLNQDLYITGTMLLTASSLNLGTKTVNMNGSNWTAIGGNITPGTSTVIFGNTIGTTVGGSGFQNFANIQLLNTATLIFPSSVVNVSGNIVVNAGGIFNTGTGTVNLNGGSTQTLNVANSNLNNITVNQTAAANVAVTSALNLIGSLDINSVSNVQSNGFMTLISTSDGTSGNARIGAIPAGAQVSGNVTVQRFMGADGFVWRHISAPVNGAIRNDLNDDFFSLQPSYLYNESVSGIQDSGWVAIAGTDPLLVGNGYIVPPRNPGALTWDLVDPVNQGNFCFPVTFTNTGFPADDGLNFIGNPYPATIDWDAATGWTKTNVGGTIFIRDYAAGPYKFWNGITGTLPNGLIATGQGFWVQANAPGPVVCITENVKSANTGAFYRVATAGGLTNHLLLSIANNNKIDKTIIKFDNLATLGFDKQFDGHKLNNNPMFNFSSIGDDGYKYCINYLPAPDTSYVIKLDISNIANGTFVMSFGDVTSFDSFYGVHLRDKLLNKFIDIRTIPTYSFSITKSNPATWGSNRFTIEFVNLNYIHPLSESSPGLVLYPNQAESMINIRLGENSDKVAGPARYYIYELSTGRLIGEGDLISRSPYLYAEVLLNNCNKGLYLVKVQAQQKVYYSKFIKQ